MSEQTRLLLLNHYSWDKTASILTSVFDEIQPKDIWHIPMETSAETSIPVLANNRDFINFIVLNILKEPHLLRTHFIQSIIRSLDETFIINNNNLERSTRENFVKILESYLNNKVYCESVRSGQITMKDKFLQNSNVSR